MGLTCGKTQQTHRSIRENIQVLEGKLVGGHAEQHYHTAEGFGLHKYPIYPPEGVRYHCELNYATPTINHAFMIYTEDTDGDILKIHRLQDRKQRDCILPRGDVTAWNPCIIPQNNKKAYVKLLIPASSARSIIPYTFETAVDNAKVVEIFDSDGNQYTKAIGFTNKVACDYNLNEDVILFHPNQPRPAIHVFKFQDHCQ